MLLGHFSITIRRIQLLAGLFTLAGLLIVGLSLAASPTVAASPSDLGWMTGGGNIVQGVRVTHGFILQCNADAGPNSLQVNWNHNQFHLESLDSALCTDNPMLEPAPPAAEFDTHQGSGTGRYNGVSGATAQWLLTDAGEPGRNDLLQITITDAAGSVVLSVSANLRGGNHQAHGAANPPLVPPSTPPPTSPPTPGPTLVHESLPTSLAPDPTATAALVTGLPSAGIGDVDPGGAALTPWLVIGATLATSGVTISLGAELARKRRALRNRLGESHQLPAGRTLQVKISPIEDFHGFVNTLQALNRAPGMAEARAVHLADGRGHFQISLASSVTLELVAEAVSESLGRAVHLQLEEAEPGRQTTAA